MFGLHSLLRFFIQRTVGASLKNRKAVNKKLSESMRVEAAFVKGDFWPTRPGSARLHIYGVI
jgi:hypothetical protein